ncbi:MAG: hypothetical protein ACI89X_003961 [Planctomycetota bacterium]|jgi:hypothetical protein
MMDDGLERAFYAAYRARNMNGYGESKLRMLRIVFAVAIACCAPLLAQKLAAQNTAAESAARGAEQFAKKSAATQKRIAKEVLETVEAVGGDTLDAIRAIVAAGEARKDAAVKPGKTKKPKKRAPKADASSWEMPATVAYIYGLRSIETRRGSATKQQALARRTAIELTLLGMMPQTDRALAELERALDNDRSADQFAAFLESWRNGDESFYEALDRTAGTKDSVFFYDVMLGDFVGAFANGKDQASRDVRKGLNASHDALHDAFLSYRQYRAFREALALSLVLPPDVPLPKRLQRYEDKASGNSLRDQVMMMLALADFDPMVVVEGVRDTADPLSKPLWATRHDPYPAWSKLFQDSIPKMLKRASSTDEFLQKAIEKRMSDARKMRKVAAMVGVGPT